jgi:hypothetical protein
MFVLFWIAQQFFSYLATVTITGDNAANLDLCLALTAFSSEGFFFYVQHLLRHGTPVFKVISESPVILTFEFRALGEGAITTYFKRLRLTVTWDLGFSGLIQGNTPFNRLLGYSGMWRIYSNRDLHGI